MKNKLSVMKTPITAVIAAIVFIAAITLAASVPVYAAEPADAEVYAFSAEDDGSYDAGPAYDGMYPDSSYSDIYDASYEEYEYDGETDTNLEAGSLDDATKEEIKNYRRQNINDSLKIMGQGMLGIFVVMFLIYLVVVILNAVTKEPAEEEDKD